MNYSSTKGTRYYNFSFDSNIEKIAFDSWFNTFHKGKNFKAKNYKLQLSDVINADNIDDDTIHSFYNQIDEDGDVIYTPIPIWRELNGDVVYAINIINTSSKVTFCSDSISALRECVLPNVFYQISMSAATVTLFHNTAAMNLHDPPNEFPENPARLVAVERVLRQHVDWRAEASALVATGVRIFAVQCMTGWDHAEPFWRSLGVSGGGPQCVRRRTQFVAVSLLSSLTIDGR